MKFRYLFSPLKIGPIEVPNRIAFTGHLTCLAENGLPSEKTAYYMAERAKGGVGLIITEETAVHPSSRVSSGIPNGYDERCIPAFKRVADAVHEHGTKIFCQIWWVEGSSYIRHLILKINVSFFVIREIGLLGAARLILTNSF